MKWDTWICGTAFWEIRNVRACILVVRGLPFMPSDCQGRLPVAWVKYDI